MTAQPVEWVLVVFYNPSAHRATYGRGVHSDRYSKDYIQLSRTREFVESLNHHFPATVSGAKADLTYQWPGGMTTGAFDFSSDRWHLKWETSLGAPQAWRMNLTPSETTAETLPGNPYKVKYADAENEFEQLASRGAGQPYLIAVKLHGESDILHLRVLLANPSSEYSWADIKLTPKEIQELARQTTKTRAIAYRSFEPGEGIFFDPKRNHDAWLKLQILEGDAAAEELEADPDEVEVFREQIESENFEVPDSVAAVKIRGSAQRAFADKVKANYGFKCAITGITTKAFLVASHIVPWSQDQTIRLDPSNGICLSLLMDRAFEAGYLLIDDDYAIRIDWYRVGDDNALRSALEPYDGQKLNVPTREAPKISYLQRRRALVVPTE
jgi:hypothetical protein